MMTTTDTAEEFEAVESLQEQPTEFTASQMMAILNDPKRKEGETFHDYKDRQKLAGKFLKAYKHGRMVWDPFIMKHMGFTNGLSMTEKNRELLKMVAQKLKEKEDNEK
jgi:hypothetical protein